MSLFEWTSEIHKLCVCLINIRKRFVSFPFTKQFMVSIGLYQSNYTQNFITTFNQSNFKWFNEQQRMFSKSLLTQFFAVETYTPISRHLCARFQVKKNKKIKFSKNTVHRGKYSQKKSNKSATMMRTHLKAVIHTHLYIYNRPKIKYKHCVC